MFGDFVGIWDTGVANHDHQESRVVPLYGHHNIIHGVKATYIGSDDPMWQYGLHQ